ncbi:biogenesis of lysosome-related organelles complex 1 subunit 1 isoform X1 [Rhipicephalus sanguineus]|uniref:biogenesis of lysosome-related organelles complex 1 subunit 1 isoform X1 n=1 Tax=Rhipicephalus sanguineus TaxID=34632 RepID=UPI001896333E|nr:biogenesis of lysosome-related organelles complex 1 subunit 1 isoform X1 [Rhipicephalus sanguineus]
MLSSLLKEHQQRQHLRREEQERKKKEATAAASALTAAMVDHLNVGVAQAYLNQRKLDAEAKQLHTNATNFSKQAANWLHLVDNFNHALKELGDIENWAKSIEADMRTVSSALEYAYKAFLSDQLVQPAAFLKATTTSLWTSA